MPLAEPVPAFTPVLTLDLNVFFDVAKRRPRGPYAAQILSASFSNVFQLTATDELAVELRRTSISETDTALEFASQMPTLPAPSDGIQQAVLDRLAYIVFPDRAKRNALTIQDRSDLRHLAIAAHHKVSAFVTAEDALVDASPALEESIGLRVVHVRDLAAVLQENATTRMPFEIGFAEGDLQVSGLRPELIPPLSSLADALRLPSDLRSRMLATGVRAHTGKLLVVSFGDTPIAAASWPSGAALNKALDVTLVVDEDQAACEVAVDILLNKLAKVATSAAPARIQLAVPKLRLSTQTVAIRCGYMKCRNDNSHFAQFQRLSVGEPITSSNWLLIRRDLKSVSNMTFPESLPRFSNQEIGSNSNLGTQRTTRSTYLI